MPLWFRIWCFYFCIKRRNVVKGKFFFPNKNESFFCLIWDCWHVQRLRNDMNYTVGVYAFVGWVSSVCGYILFLVWAFAPESVLHDVIGVTYYPSRYYALALPSYLMVVYVFVGTLYIGLNLISTLDPDDMYTVRDEHSRPAPASFIVCNQKNNSSGGGGGGLPDIGDIDPCQVSKLLYYSPSTFSTSTSTTTK